MSETSMPPGGTTTTSRQSSKTNSSGGALFGAGCGGLLVLVVLSGPTFLCVGTLLSIDSEKKETQAQHAYIREHGGPDLLDLPADQLLAYVSPRELDIRTRVSAEITEDRPAVDVVSVRLLSAEATNPLDFKVQTSATVREPWGATWQTDCRCDYAAELRDGNPEATFRYVTCSLTQRPRPPEDASTRYTLCVQERALSSSYLQKFASEDRDKLAAIFGPGRSPESACTTLADQESAAAFACQIDVLANAIRTNTPDPGSKKQIECEKRYPR